MKELNLCFTLIALWLDESCRNLNSRTNNRHQLPNIHSTAKKKKKRLNTRPIPRCGHTTLTWLVHSFVQNCLDKWLGILRIKRCSSILSYWLFCTPSRRAMKCPCLSYRLFVETVHLESVSRKTQRGMEIRLFPKHGWRW